MATINPQTGYVTGSMADKAALEGRIASKGASPSGSKPQPSKADAITFTQLPGVPTYSSLTPDEQMRVTQTALNTLGRAPVDQRESETLLGAALNPQRVSQLGIAPIPQNLPQTAAQLQLATGAAREQMLQAGQSQRAYQSEAKAALPVLEQALKQAGGMTEMSLGESDLFKAAGLTGFATLAQSLGERMEEMDRKTESFRSVLRDTFAGFQGTNQTFLDTHRNAIEAYESINDEYKFVANQLFELEKQRIDFENDIMLLNEKARIDAALAARRSTGAQSKLTDGAKFVQQQRALGLSEEQILNQLNARVGSLSAQGDREFANDALNYMNALPASRAPASFVGGRPSTGEEAEFITKYQADPASLQTLEDFTKLNKVFWNKQLESEPQMIVEGAKNFASSLQGVDKDTQKYLKELYQAQYSSYQQPVIKDVFNTFK
jgi:hypothetical protein